MAARLNVKDLVLVGVFTALMWVVAMVISVIMSLLGPATNVFYPPVVALVDGVVAMLLLAKVPKRGVFTIVGVLQCVLFLLVGAFWMLPVSLALGGLVADLAMIGRKRVARKAMAVAYAVYSAFLAFGAIGPIKFLQDDYVALCQKNNLPQEYIDALIQLTSLPLLVVIVVGAFVCGLLGAYLGQKMLKKHFVKAGLVAVEGARAAERR